MSRDGRDISDVFAIMEHCGRSRWVRIGVAFTNRDGLINVRLDTVPAPGAAIQIRQRREPVGGVT